MSDRPVLTTERGAAVTDNQNSQTAGPGGPTLLQDQYLIEKLARFNRDRIAERVVHAVGMVDNIAGSLAQVSRDDIIARAVDHFRRADPEYGRRVAEGVASRRGAAVAGAAP